MHSISPIRVFPMAALCWLSVFAAPAQDLRLATGSPGGTFFGVGEELARFLNRRLPGMTMEPLETGGSTENLRLLGSSEADLALVTQDALEAEIRASRRSAGAASPPPRSRFCIVGPLYVGAAQFVLRRELVRTGTLADLNGVLLYPGARGSGAEEGTLSIIEALGIEPRLVAEGDRTLGYEEAAAALIQGKFDAATLSGGLPVRAVERLMARHRGEFRILSFTEEQASLAIERVAGLVHSRIAPGTYPGQSAEVRSVGKRTLLVARSGLEAGIIGRIAAAIQAGTAQPGTGLRGPEIHAALRALTVSFWRQDLGVARCAPLQANPD